MKKFLIGIIMALLFALPTLALDIPEGAIIKTATNPDVYIVKYLNGKSYKRLVLNPQVFQSYGHLKWENLLTVDASVMDSFAVSDLVRVDGQTQIYHLTPDGDVGSKMLLTDTSGMDGDSVYTINDVDFGNYTNFSLTGLSGPYEIYRTADGDTVTVTINGVHQTVRLIGIDTPEVSGPYTQAECYGTEASEAAKTKLSGKKVYLEADFASGDKDKYDRLLRYVYLEDGTPFNKWMIAEGYAREYTYNGIAYKYQAEFKAAQVSAKTGGKGLWASGTCSATASNNPVSGTYNCSINTYNCTDFTTQAEAQAAYAYCIGKVGTDIHQLDSDKDGTVCESL